MFTIVLHRIFKKCKQFLQERLDMYILNSDQGHVILEMTKDNYISKFQKSLTVVCILLKNYQFSRIRKLTL